MNFSQELMFEINIEKESDMESPEKRTEETEGQRIKQSLFKKQKASSCVWSRARKGWG